MTLRRIILVVLLLSCMNAAPFAQAAELLSQFHPYISVKEEYNDNLNLTPTNKIEDFITTVQPGIRFSNMGKTGGCGPGLRARGGILREIQQFELHQPQRLAERKIPDVSAYQLLSQGILHPVR